MRAIICDKCGETQADSFYGTTADINRQHIGTPREIHLCSKCTDEFVAWVRGESPKHDSYPEITW